MSEQRHPVSPATFVRLRKFAEDRAHLVAQLALIDQRLADTGTTALNEAGIGFTAIVGIDDEEGPPAVLYLTPAAPCPTDATANDA